MSLSMMPLPAVGAGWLLAGLAFVVGASIGSFLNVCIYRLPEDESVVTPRSRCPGCGTQLAWYDNIPLLSFALLGARCRTCGVAISMRYPLVEAATGALALLALAYFGETPYAAVAFAFTASLLLITFIDLDHRFIPDEVSLPGIAVGIAVAFLPGGVTPEDAVLGALLGGGILWSVAWGYKRATGVEGMGLGDVKLLAMIGAFLGWQAVPTVLVVASLAGSVAGLGVMLVRGASRAGRRVARKLGLRALAPFAQRAARRTEIPFGPFLALGAVLALYVPALVSFWRLG
jgi:leader peptidase (prepilin peptidase)/N-methyltransferase